MKEFFEIVLDSVIDSGKILPILLLVYFLIEFFEHRQASKFESMKFMNKKYSPLLGSFFGSLPQCGFSIVTTDLYNKRKVSVGALIAVYIATSDEALPVMISQPSSYKWILPLLLTKILIAVAVGYLAQLLFDLIFVKKTLLKQKNINSNLETDNKSIDVQDKNTAEQFVAESIENQELTNHIETHEHHEEDHNYNDEHEHHEEIEKTHHGCCHHDIEHSKYDWKHPLFHSLKVIVMIFVINIIFGCIIHFGFKGEDNLAKFLTGNTVYALQPLLAMLIGFIPNCASSVVLTQLYLIGGLSFGSLIGGLIVNAGLGLILLLKENKHPKENLFIILTLVISSLSFGYLLHYII